MLVCVWRGGRRCGICVVMIPPALVLHAPQMGENIGAAARVMANFALTDLRLVAPRDSWPQERAWAAASGADWPLNAARVYETVADAIADRLRPQGRVRPA